MAALGACGGNTCRPADYLPVFPANMRIVSIGMVFWLGAGMALAAEHKFDLASMTVGEAPKGFTSTVVGSGKPGTWKVLLDEVPVGDPSATNASKTAKKSVLAQVSVADMTDRHFPLLILGDDTYGDFKFTARVKIEKSIFEEAAGIAFRIQDERNYYALRASAANHTLQFYKVENGQEGKSIGPVVRIVTGLWYELAVECKGTAIRVFLDGQEWPLGTLQDASFAAGKIGVWTKTDSVAHFADMSITYTPREPFAQLMVRDTMKEYPRLLGLKVFMAPTESKPRMVASDDEKEIGQSGEKTDGDVIDRGVNYYRKQKDIVWVTMPLRDRNGDIVAAVRVMMKSFPGQTEENAVVRAMPIVKEMQKRASSVNSLLE